MNIYIYIICFLALHYYIMYIGMMISRFSTIAGDLPGFRQLFCKSICSALGLPAHGNCVEVLNVSSGSIVVEFLLRPRAHTEPCQKRLKTQGH